MLNQNCVACRAAKVKCDRAEPACARCTRLGLSCEFDKRRSKWDTVQSSRPPATLAEKPEYAELLQSIAKYKPGFSTHCYRDKLIELMNQLVEVAYLHDDAAAISWATMQMHMHGIPLSSCTSLQRASHPGDGIQPGLDDALPAELATIFDDDHPGMGWVCVGDRKAFVCNPAFPVTASQIAAARSLDETADLVGVVRSAPTRTHATCVRCASSHTSRPFLSGLITLGRWRPSKSLWRNKSSR